MNRTLFISSPCHLRVKQGQLVVERRDDGTKLSAPVQDLAHVVLENNQITLTIAVLQVLGDANVGVTFCNPEYQPAHMLLTLTGNNLAQERFRYQLRASAALQRQLWQQTVRAKVKNQAAALNFLGFDDAALKYLSTKVLLNDKTNVEARAARIYWGIMYGTDFIRKRYGSSPNHLLNFSYTILRSAMARALSAAGLLPMLGIHHHNRYNHFCLADDIMEPFRPLADLLVYRIFTERYSGDDIPKAIKLELTSLLDSDIIMNGQQYILRYALERVSITLLKSFETGKPILEFPDLYDMS